MLWYFVLIFGVMYSTFGFAGSLEISCFSLKRDTEIEAGYFTALSV